MFFHVTVMLYICTLINYRLISNTSTHIHTFTHARMHARMQVRTLLYPLHTIRHIQTYTRNNTIYVTLICRGFMCSKACTVHSHL